MLTEREIARVNELVPEAWLGDVESFETAAVHRDLCSFDYAVVRVVPRVERGAR